MILIKKMIFQNIIANFEIKTAVFYLIHIFPESFKTYQ